MSPVRDWAWFCANRTISDISAKQFALSVSSGLSVERNRFAGKARDCAIGSSRSTENLDWFRA